MKLLTTLSNFLFGKPRSLDASCALRNKAGGMAWIKPHMHGTGAEALFGQVVRTICVSPDRFWTIDPMPTYVARVPLTDDCGTAAWPGERLTVVRLSDDVLEPIPDTGVSDEEVRELYAPKEPSHV